MQDLGIIAIGAGKCDFEMVLSPEGRRIQKSLSGVTPIGGKQRTGENTLLKAGKSAPPGVVDWVAEPQPREKTAKDPKSVKNRFFVSFALFAVE
jgi:hypothetical protein